MPTTLARTSSMIYHPERLFPNPERVETLARQDSEYLLHQKRSEEFLLTLRLTDSLQKEAAQLAYCCYRWAYLKAEAYLSGSGV